MHVRSVCLSLVLLATAAFVLEGCDPLPPETEMDSIRSSGPATKSFTEYSREDQLIYQAVLEAMFERWKTDGPAFHVPQVYFIQLDGRDGPDDLLRMLRLRGYRVDVGSRWEEGRGVQLSMDRVRLDGFSHATVYGGYLFGSVGGEWGPFILAKHDGKWRVVQWTADMFA